MTKLLQFLIGNTKQQENEYNEVHRLGVAGDYVKVVKLSTYASIPEFNGEPSFKVGDIIKIIDDPNKYSRFIKGKDKNGISYVLSQEEYVVLEGYVPTGIENKYD